MVTQECLSHCHLQISLVLSPKMHIAFDNAVPSPFSRFSLTHQLWLTVFSSLPFPMFFL